MINSLGCAAPKLPKCGKRALRRFYHDDARLRLRPGVSRVVYDISSKPPATVEWE